MKTFVYAFAVAAAALTANAASADDKKQSGPGTTGAMEKAPAPGVATDPGGVKAQQGDTSKASPGTVGAAPSADTPSQTGKGK